MDPKSPKIRQILGKLLSLAFRKPTTNPAINSTEDAELDSILERLDNIDSSRRTYNGRETIDISHQSFDDPSPRVDISQWTDRTHPNYRYSPSSVSLASAQSHGSSLDSGQGGGTDEWHGIQMDSLNGANNDAAIFSRWFPDLDPSAITMSLSSTSHSLAHGVDNLNTYPMSSLIADPSGRSVSGAYLARWPLNSANNFELPHGALHPRRDPTPQQEWNFNSARNFSTEFNEDYATHPHLIPGDHVRAPIQYNTVPNSLGNPSAITGYNSELQSLCQASPSNFQSTERSIPDFVDSLFTQDPADYHARNIPESSTRHNAWASRPANSIPGYDARIIQPTGPYPYGQHVLGSAPSSSFLPPMSEGTFGRPLYRHEHPRHAGADPADQYNDNSYSEPPTASNVLNSNRPSLSNNWPDNSSILYNNVFPDAAHFQDAHGWSTTPASSSSYLYNIGDVQTQGSIGPMRAQTSGKYRSTAGSSNSSNPSRQGSSQNLRQDVLKKTLATPLTDSEINKIIVALPIWKDVLKKVASQFCKVISTGPLLIMDTGKFTAWLRSRRQLREILDTELVNAALPVLPRSLDPFDPGQVDYYIRKMRRQLMLVAQTIGKYYDLEPQGILSTDVQGYTSAVSKRVQVLLTGFCFIFLDDDDIFHPAIWEGLIDFLWFPEGYGEAIGDAFASEFDTGMPLWLIANFGGIVMHSLTSYALLRRVRLSSKPQFEAKEYAQPTHTLFNILLAKFRDPVHGPRFRARLVEWVDDGRARRQATNDKSAGKKRVSRRRSQAAV